MEKKKGGGGNGVAETKNEQKICCNERGGLSIPGSNCAKLTRQMGWNTVGDHQV